MGARANAAASHHGVAPIVQCGTARPTAPPMGVVTSVRARADVRRGGAGRCASGPHARALEVSSAVDPCVAGATCDGARAPANLAGGGPRARSPCCHRARTTALAMACAERREAANARPAGAASTVRRARARMTAQGTAAAKPMARAHATRAGMARRVIWAPARTSATSTAHAYLRASAHALRASTVSIVRATSALWKAAARRKGGGYVSRAAAAVWRASQGLTARGALAPSAAPATASVRPTAPAAAYLGSRAPDARWAAHEAAAGVAVAPLMARASAAAAGAGLTAPCRRFASQRRGCCP
jgi:DNA polymerase-3 subunit gamma/tau